MTMMSLWIYILEMSQMGKMLSEKQKQEMSQKQCSMVLVMPVFSQSHHNHGQVREEVLEVLVCKDSASNSCQNPIFDGWLKVKP